MKTHRVERLVSVTRRMVTIVLLAENEDEALYEKDGEYRGSFNTESRKDWELFGPFGNRNS